MLHEVPFQFISKYSHIPTPPFPPVHGTGRAGSAKVSAVVAEGHAAEDPFQRLLIEDVLESGLENLVGHDVVQGRNGEVARCRAWTGSSGRGGRCTSSCSG